MKGALQDSPNGTSLESIYNRYRNLMLWAAQKYVETDDCEDIVHEAFLKVIRAADMILHLPDHKIQTYILLIVRGTAIDYFRKKHRYLQVDMEDDILHSFITDHTEKTVGGYSKTELFMMMQSLPPDEQALLIGKYYLDLSSRELTELVGGTDTGMRTKLLRARKRVFEEWSKAGLCMEDFLDE